MALNPPSVWGLARTDGRADREHASAFPPPQAPRNDGFSKLPEHREREHCIYQTRARSKSERQTRYFLKRKEEPCWKTKAGTRGAAVGQAPWMAAVAGGAESRETGGQLPPPPGQGGAWAAGCGKCTQHWLSGSFQHKDECTVRTTRPSRKADTETESPTDPWAELTREETELTPHTKLDSSHCGAAGGAGPACGHPTQVRAPVLAVTLPAQLSMVWESREGGPSAWARHPRASPG